MRQNFANRLAAGGVWALYIAQMSMEVARQLREDNIMPPIGSGSDAEVFTVCGVGAFNHVANGFMPEGQKMKTSVVPVKPTVTLRDKLGRTITPAHWQLLQSQTAYYRVGLWANDARDKWVYTIWSGLDKGDGRIYESTVIGNGNKILRLFRTRTEPEARGAHQLLIEAVKQGEL